MIVSHRRDTRGFSKAELVMVLSLLGLTTVGVTLVARPSLAKDSEQTTERVAPLLAALSDWQTENSGQCPTIGQLVADGYLDSSVSRDDPWGSVYRVHCAEGKLFLHSDGKDNRPNTSDDFRVEVP
jgi:hypothetical protein